MHCRADGPCSMACANDTGVQHGGTAANNQQMTALPCHLDGCKLLVAGRAPSSGVTLCGCSAGARHSFDCRAMPEWGGAVCEAAGCAGAAERAHGSCLPERLHLLWLLHHHQPQSRCSEPDTPSYVTHVHPRCLMLALHALAYAPTGAALIGAPRCCKSLVRKTDCSMPAALFLYIMSSRHIVVPNRHIGRRGDDAC